MEPYLYLGISPIFGFLVGVLSGLGLVGLWLGIHLRANRVAADTLLGPPYDDNPQDRAANERVEACKKRLRRQKTPNPEWIAPLVDEIPKLIQEIAEIYYPDAEEPMWAPGMSHFARAIHITAMQIADFLQTSRIGGLIDVSATTALETGGRVRKVAKNKFVKKLYSFYRRVRPALQVIWYKSPWMWVGLAVSNMAVRTLQPKVIDIVAQRAIELYSGRLSSRARYVTS